jgi:ferrous iron transport protein B
MISRKHGSAHPGTIALVGNPNSGKTTLFNALTGLHHKVGNYPGVTVEKREAQCALAGGREATVIDLPGTYSLHPTSPDEQIVADALLGRLGAPPPDVVVCVVDATHLERNLYIVTQILDCEIPAVVALTMYDIAEQHNARIDIKALEEALRIPVVPVVAHQGRGIAQVRDALARIPVLHRNGDRWNLPEPLFRAHQQLSEVLHTEYHLPPNAARYEATALLVNPDTKGERIAGCDDKLQARVHTTRERLAFLGIDPAAAFIESRYAWIRNVCSVAIQTQGRADRALTDAIDRIVTHKFWGFLLFLGVMAIVFQSIFSWASYPMELIAGGFDALARLITAAIPPGDLRDMIVNGALAGVAGVVTFLPQIAFLFLFLGLLEDSGYMARAAFIMDKLMSKVGLHGKSFIPLLGSFACAVPGIMATRTIENPKDRLATILVAPLMSCSARLPVYSLLIAACVPPTLLFGVFSYQGLTLLALYVGGMAIALFMAWLFKRTLLRGQPALFIMELPPYKMPSVKTVLFLVWERVQTFLKTAGTIILGVSILLWFLVTYPKSGATATPAEHLAQSYAGRMGIAIEPAIQPLGFDWKIGIGLISSMLQREAFVSAMATIFNVADDDNRPGITTLERAMRDDIDARSGKQTFGLATTLALLTYYLVALQCLSTVAVVRRETNSWKWPAFQFVYMFVLAYAMAFAVYHGVRFLGGAA